MPLLDGPDVFQKSYAALHAFMECYKRGATARIDEQSSQMRTTGVVSRFAAGPKVKLK